MVQDKNFADNGNKISLKRYYSNGEIIILYECISRNF